MLKGNTYFIDVVGSAAGFAYVAEEILRDFHNAGLDAPNLLLMTMNRLNIDRHDDGRNSMIAKENPDQNGHTILYLPSVDDTRFITLSKEVYVKSHMRLDMLSDNGMRGYPEYNASYWQEEYDSDLLSKEEEPHYSKTMQILLEYFDYNIQSLYLLSQRNIKSTDVGCQSCGKKENLSIEMSEPYGIYCSKECQKLLC
jgi:hypothetical protein